MTMTRAELFSRAERGEIDVRIYCPECDFDFIGNVKSSDCATYLDECPECGSPDLDIEEA